MGIAKKIFIALVTVVLLLIDWTALNDIMSGEPNTVSEYVTLFGSVVIIVVLLSYTLGQRKKQQKELAK